MMQITFERGKYLGILLSSLEFLFLFDETHQCSIEPESRPHVGCQSFYRMSTLNCQRGPDGETEWDEAVVWSGERKGRDEVER